MSKEKLVVLIPTLNEATAIGQTIDDVQKYVPECRILVIDSHSYNGTAEIALSKGATVIDAPRGGKGKALRSVLPRILRDYDSQWYVMIDGDYTYPAKHIPEIVVMLKGWANVAMGYRAVKAPGSMTTINKIGNWGLSLLAGVLYGGRVKDLCTGMWGFRRKALRKFAITSDGFTLEADIFINTVRNHCQLAQIPIEYRARLKGDTPKLGVSDGFKIAWFLIKEKK